MAVELLGYCDVDAGLLMIGDPCYHVAEKHEDWIKWLNDNNIFDSSEVSLKHKGGGGGAGIVSNTAYGDGSYPVYRVGKGSMVVNTEFCDDRKIVDDLRALADKIEQDIKEYNEDDE